MIIAIKNAMRYPNNDTLIREELFVNSNVDNTRKEVLNGAPHWVSSSIARGGMRYTQVNIAG
jgi:hypothetical protein